MCDSVTSFVLLVSLLLFLPHARSLNFSFPSFDSSTPNILFENDSFASNGVIHLTGNQQDSSLTSSVGRASYSLPVLLWDKSTGNVSDFTTHFSFIIKQVNSTSYGDGLTFLLAPLDSRVPDGSTGGYLGLVTSKTYNLTSENQFVAVEFDTFRNCWDPNPDHVGINVNSIVSVAKLTWSSSMKNGTIANAWISYDSSAKSLSIFLTYADNPVFDRNSNLSYIIDLSTVLLERVRVGFSASTGRFAEIHNVLSWDFTSTLAKTNETGLISTGKRIKRKAGLIGGIVAGIGVLVAELVWVGIMWWRKRPGMENQDTDFGFDDHNFETGTTGPRKFTYLELSQATNNFSEEGKLGEECFGGVCFGLLGNPKREIAVKMISKGSKQGKKEYVSEVKIISQLRHKNLVQLFGWCHDQGNLLLVSSCLMEVLTPIYMGGRRSLVA